MKKIILILMFVIGCLSFSNGRNLFTDKKLHWDKIQGSWEGGMIELRKQKNNYFVIITESERTVMKARLINGYIIESSNGDRYAYDTKCKGLAALYNKSTKVMNCLSRKGISGIN